MKKISLIILCLAVAMLFPVFAFAEEETTADNSTPRLMVTEYKLFGDTLTPGGQAKFSLTVKNMSRTTDIKNILLTLSDGTGEIIPEGTGTCYVESIRAGKSYTWEMTVAAAKTAGGGRHELSFSAEYENTSGAPFSATASVFAEVEKPAETTTKKPAADNSAPRLIVTGYEVENGFVSPGERAKLTVTVENKSKTKAIKNVLFTLTDGEKEIVPDGTGTLFVDLIGAGKSRTLTFSLTAVHSARQGRHELSLTAEYEAPDGSPLSADASVYADVRQEASLDYSGAVLPKKAAQGETVTLGINLMNTGKSEISNVKIDFEIDGFTSGGASFLGTIPAGEGKPCSVNLQVSKEKLGEVKGKIIFTYEDGFGEKFTKEQTVSALIEKKAETTKADTAEKEKKNPQWWAFLTGGVILGGGAAFGAFFAMQSRKQRRKDEETL